MAYTTEKLSKTRVAIYKDGEYLCQLMPKEVVSWIFRAERSDALDAECATTERAIRIEAAKAYLAKRTERPVTIQLSMF